MKILVCDDKLRQSELTERAIETGVNSTLGHEVKTLVASELKDSLRSFFDAVSRVLNGGGGSETGSIDSAFSGFDILIVDNNLTGLELDGARLTAETIIGYLRVFSDTPYIVSLNKNLHVDFDLRYLFGDYQSLADLAVNTSHLSNSCLWGRKTRTDFSPWYWPLLADAVSRRRGQIDFIANNLERSVWDALTFPPEADDYLSLRAKSPLYSTDGNPREASFDVFCDSSRLLPPAEVVTLKQLAAEENEFAMKSVLQISAYEVDRWLRRDVLGTQDVLIDLPHLVVQMPFLLGAKGSNLDYWNEVIMHDEPPYGLDVPLFEAHLEPARFEHWMWVPGPCFWWPTLKSDDTLTERFFEAEGDWPDAVFCEDVSGFVHVVGSGEADSPKEFEAEIEGSWARRYIAVVGNYLYSPRSRILGGTA